MEIKHPAGARWWISPSFPRWKTSSAPAEVGPACGGLCLPGRRGDFSERNSTGEHERNNGSFMEQKMVVVRVV